MPLSQANNRLYTRSSQLVGQTADGLDIDGLDDIGEAIADADLFIIDNGGGGTNTKTAVTRIPTYVYSGISGQIAINSSGVASFASDASGTNLTLSGNLTVNGDTVSVNTTTVTVDDPMFALADNNSADTVDIGWYGKYVDSGTKYSGLFRDASDSDMWKLFSATGNSHEAPTTTVNTTSGFTLANLSVNGLTATTLSGTLAASNISDVASLSEISSVASDDVFIAIDTSGGGLKKITRSAIVAGLATSSAIANLSEDTTPQLGGDLDVNSNDIISVSNGDISILPNGSGKVIMDGNGSSGGISISDGTIDIRTGTGSVAKILFYCESSNAHAQTVQAQPHSAGVTNTLTLPAGGSGELVSTVATQTLTNKSLGSDLDIFEDANNADVKLTMGTSATESLTIQVLNGGSNKTAESVSFATATASATGDHGKFTFNVDGTDIFDVDDSGINLASGKTFRINGTTIDGDITSVVAGTGLSGGGTDGDVTLNVDASQAITALTGGDLTIYEDANNADVSLKLGTSATEALSIEVLNGGSNKTAEEIHFSTATASGTADHGKMVFDIDGTDILTIDDGGLVVKTTGTIGPVGDEDLVTLTASGSIVTVAGELSVTTLDIGGTNVTFTAAELNLLDGDTSVGGSITLADGDGVVVNDGGTMKTIPASDVKTYASGDSATKGFAIAMAVAL